MFGTDNQHYQPAQLYHVAQDGLSCELIPACEALRSDIYYYWILTIEADSVLLPIIPDGAVDLVFSPQIPDFAAVFTPRTARFELPLQGPVVYAGVCLHAEKVGRIFSHSLRKLDMLEAGLGVIETLGLSALVQSIQGEYDKTALASAFNNFFSNAANRVNAAVTVHEKNILADAFDLLEVGGVRTMARQVGLSERQFRRVAKDLFGLGPKQIHRIVRLQEALRELLYTDELSQSDYYDDSHRIRELKALTGLTPGNIRRMAEKYNNKKTH